MLPFLYTQTKALAAAMASGNGNMLPDGADPFYRPAGAPIKPSVPTEGTGEPIVLPVVEPPKPPSTVTRPPCMLPLSHVTFLGFFSMLDSQSDTGGHPLPAVTAATLHYAPNMEPTVTAMFKHMPDGKPSQTKTWPLFAVEVRFQVQIGWKDEQWLLEVNERNVQL